MPRFSSVFGFMVTAFALLTCGTALAATKPQVNFRVILFKQEMTVHQNGSYTNTIERIIQPLTMAGVQSQSQMSIEYPANFAQVHIIHAYTENSSGTKYPVSPKAIYTQSSSGALSAPFLSDGRIKSVVFPNVAPGDTLHIRYHIHYDHAYLPGIYALSTLLAPNIPVTKAQIILNTMASQKIIGGQQGKVWQQSSPISVDGRNRLSYNAHLQKISYPPLGSPALSQYAPLAVLTTASTWKQVAQAYNQIAAPALRETPELRKTAETVTAGTSGIQAVKALYHWMQKNIHSISINYSNAGFTPPLANATLQRGVGDSNANTILLCALLRAVHIQAEPALISTSARFRTYPAVDPFAFGHFIVYLPSYGLFLDPTSRYAGVHSLPLQDANRPVLITGSAPKMMRTPGPDLSVPLIEKHTQLLLHANGDLQEKSTEIRRGYAAQEVRSALIGSKGRMLMKELRNNFYKQGNLGELQSIAFQNRKDLDKPLGLKTIAQEENVFIPGKKIAMMMPTDTSIARPLELFTADANRATPSLVKPTYLNSVITLRLPNHYHPAYLPQNNSLHTSIGNYSIHYALVGDILTIQQKLWLPHFIVSAQDYPQLHQLAIASSSNSRAGLLLLKNH
ncbi:MAG: DUF3857 and transglutaminase domain-containing protein [Acidithiobacillus sp.]